MNLFLILLPLKGELTKMTKHENEKTSTYSRPGTLLSIGS